MLLIRAGRVGRHAQTDPEGDFLVRELMGTQPPTYRPAPIAIGPELLSELFA